MPEHTNIPSDGKPTFQQTKKNFTRENDSIPLGVDRHVEPKQYSDNDEMVF